MSGDVVIRAEGLAKKYVIGHQAQRESYVALRDVIARNARALGRTAMDLVRGRPNVVGDEVEEFWALRDVSFEIRRGDVVGVIGRNGAGKSTLLKVLSRITEPSEGRVEIKGRVASLLEVGTGFHPELTGRENIYLNGAVLGMTHAEIRRKFDEIVAFAEVEKFLDTPVKRYSSGMYVRLAFAVAAHLEPEILIVDEVLAVGDAEFQKKCLGKMGEVAGQGRTVLFVSHNMASIASLCETVILLTRGRITANAPVTEVLARYAASARHGDSGHSPGTLYVREGEAPIKEAAVLRVDMLDAAGAPASFVQSFGPVTFRATIGATRAFATLSVIFWIKDYLGVIIAKFESNPKNISLYFSEGTFVADCQIAHLPLIPGEYSVGVGLAHFGARVIEHKEDIGMFTVSTSSESELQMSPYAEGVIATRLQWAARSEGRDRFGPTPRAVHLASSALTWGD